MSDVAMMPPKLSSDELDDLRTAVRLLEGDSFATRLTRLIGGQARALGQALPAAAKKAVALATDAALKTALRVALRSLGKTSSAKARVRWHQAAAAATGALGGAFGIAATAVELPISTTILLRSIAEIAREHGETLDDPEAAFACLNVFGLGADRTDGAERSRYYAARAQLAGGLSDVDFMLVKQGIATELAPMLTRYLSQIAARFGVVVTEKLAAQALPVVGAVGGAAVNAAFAQHFQALARGHFLVRRLERKHGVETVRFEYERLRGEMKPR
jgi:hypothetical protein